MSCSHFTFIFIFFLLISLSLIREELRILAKSYIFLTHGYKINRFMGEGMGGQAVSGRVRKLTPDLPKGKKKTQAGARSSGDKSTRREMSDVISTGVVWGS